MKTGIRTLVLLFCCLNIASCSLFNCFDTYFPSKTHLENQYQTILENENSLNELEPDVGVFVSQSVVISALKDVSSNIEANVLSQDIEIRKFKPVFSFDKQIIPISGSIDVELKEEKIRVSANILGHVGLV